MTNSNSIDESTKDDVQEEPRKVRQVGITSEQARRQDFARVICNKFTQLDRDLRRARIEMYELHDAAVNAIGKDRLEEDCTLSAPLKIAPVDIADDEPGLIIGRYLQCTLMIPLLEQEIEKWEPLYLYVTDVDLDALDMEHPTVRENWLQFVEGWNQAQRKRYAAWYALDKKPEGE